MMRRSCDSWVPAGRRLQGGIPLVASDSGSGDDVAESGVQ